MKVYFTPYIEYTVTLERVGPAELAGAKCLPLQWAEGQIGACAVFTDREAAQRYLDARNSNAKILAGDMPDPS